MKKLLLLTVALGVLTAMTGCKVHFANSSSGWSANDLTAATNVVQTAAIPAGLKGLDVDNRFGAIHITGTDTGATSWTWKLAVQARTEAIAEKLASSASCKAELVDGQLKLVVTLPDTKEPHGFQSDFEIRVPKSAAARAQNRFGRIDIADLAGDVEATDENGRLEIWNIGGSVRARTSFDSLS
ncbi:MAG TPA: hypothetical protein VFC07_11540, partial [Verrucomicrobiae bacterium]|nr:hypothetical protein [Verrucomicrobiae bacterium]